MGTIRQKAKFCGTADQERSNNFAWIEYRIGLQISIRHQHWICRAWYTLYIMMLPFSHYWWPLCTLCKYLLSLVRVGYVELDIHYAKRVCLSTALQPNASLLFRQDPTKYHNSTSHLAADACYIPCKLYFWVFEARTLSFFLKNSRFSFLSYHFF